VGGQPLMPVGPVFPNQVVDIARKSLLGFEGRVGVGTQEVEGQCVATPLPSAKESIAPLWVKKKP
jgi:hypothetical protein